jgi:hypothetical protein
MEVLQNIDGYDARKIGLLLFVGIVYKSGHDCIFAPCLNPNGGLYGHEIHIFYHGLI